MKIKFSLCLSLLFFAAQVLAQIPTNGLILYYPFDSDANDYSGNTNHGTMNGTPQFQTGLNNNAIHLTGIGYVGNAGDHVLIPQVINNSMTEFSISLWVKEEGLTSTDGEAYIFFGDNQTGWAGILRDGQNNKVSFAVGGSNSTSNIIIPFKPCYLNTFVHYVITYNNSMMKAYINGQLVGSMNQTVSIANSNAGLGIHWWWDLSTRFIGMMDEFRIYNRELTFQEVQQIYTPFSYSNNCGVYSPKITLSANTVLAGQTMTISGQDFTPNGSVSLKYYGAGGLYIENETADAQGLFSHTYTAPLILDMSQNGLSAVKGIDDNTITNSNIKSFFLSPNTPAPDKYITIQTPSSIDSYNTGDNVSIQWTDKMIINNNLFGVTANAIKNYKLEYSINNGSWQTIGNILQYQLQTFAGYYQSFNSSFQPVTNGSYRIKVSDMDNANNFEISTSFDVLTSANNGFSIARVWDYSGNRPTNIEPKGVCADGTSRFYVKVSKKVGNSKTIGNVLLEIQDPTLSSQDINLVGAVKNASVVGYSLEANTASQVTTQNINPISGEYWFWYVAPSDFSRDANDEYSGKRNVQATVTVTYTDFSSENATFDIQIVRPPLLMVHGLAGSEHSWDNFSFTNTITGNEDKFKSSVGLFQSGIFVYNMCPQCSFKENAASLLSLNPNTSQLKPNVEANSFQHALLEARNRGFATNRVDYVCHSMGGSMLRTAINYFDVAYLSPTNAIFKNYEQGFVNKAITLNTPHNGSPMADFIADEFHNLPVHRRWELSRAYDKFDIVQSFIKKDIDWDFVALGDVYKCNATDAVNDLRAVGDGIRFYPTTVKNHTIAGKTELDLVNVVNYTNYLTYGNVDIESGLNFTLGFGINDINNYLIQKGYSNFFYDSDWVVPMSSQLAGKPEYVLDFTQSVFTGANKNHLNIHSVIESGNVTLNLLNASINSSSFADVILANPNPGLTHYKTNSVDSTNEYVDTLKVKILAPLSNPSYYVDSTLIVTLRLKDTTGFRKLYVTFQGRMYESVAKTDTQTFSIQINSNYLHGQKLFVSALYDSVGYNIYYHDIADITVLTDNTPLGLVVLPETKLLYKAETYIPDIHALHSNYVTDLLINDPSLSIFIADTNVVRFDASINRFVAKDSGTTYVVLDYSSFKDTIYLKISSTLNETNATNAIDNPNDYSNQIHAIVYPNPSSSDFYIDYILPQSTNIEIVVLNFMGQTIKTLKYENQIEGNHKAKIEMEGVANGLYLLHIKTGFGTFTTKLLKN